MIEKNDWRIMGQDKYLKGKIFEKKYFKGSDHNHCEFCWKKFGLGDNDLKSGYSSEDGKFWICEDCFKDFSKLFDLKLKDN